MSAASLEIITKRDFNKIVNLLKPSMVNAIARSFQKLSLDAADVIALRMKAGIIRGRKGWRSLKKETVQRKGHRRKLIETGAMIRAIRRKNLTKNTAFVGIERGKAKHPRTGEDMALVGTIHETGAKDEKRKLVIPARPWIKPALEEFLKKDWPKMGDKKAEDVLDIMFTVT